MPAPRAEEELFAYVREVYVAAQQGRASRPAGRGARDGEEAKQAHAGAREPPGRAHGRRRQRGSTRSGAPGAVSPPPPPQPRGRAPGRPRRRGSARTAPPRRRSGARNGRRPTTALRPPLRLQQLLPAIVTTVVYGVAAARRAPGGLRETPRHRGTSTARSGRLLPLPTVGLNESADETTLVRADAADGVARLTTSTSETRNRTPGRRRPAHLHRAAR